MVRSLLGAEAEHRTKGLVPEELGSPASVFMVPQTGLQPSTNRGFKQDALLDAEADATAASESATVDGVAEATALITEAAGALDSTPTPATPQR